VPLFRSKIVFCISTGNGLLRSLKASRRIGGSYQTWSFTFVILFKQKLWVDMRFICSGSFLSHAPGAMAQDNGSNACAESGPQGPLPVDPTTGSLSFAVGGRLAAVTPPSLTG
jgi:hypothetical protein